MYEIQTIVHNIIQQMHVEKQWHKSEAFLQSNQKIYVGSTEKNKNKENKVKSTGKYW